MTIDEIRLVEKELEKILPIFLDEFIEYIPLGRRRNFMEKIRQGRTYQLINFDTGFGAWCKDEKIILGIQNNAIFKKLTKHVNYGNNKGATLLSNEDIINNDKDYLDYMDYFIGNGLTELDYCLDVLPHEVMHLIGSSDGVLGEGITEYRARQVCQKYGIRCAPIMHSKETKFVRMLEEIVGPMELNEATFLKNFYVLERECEKIFGKEAFREAYEDVCINYRTYRGDNTRDPLEHYKNYRDIDFSKLYNLIEARKEVTEEENNKKEEENAKEKLQV